MEEFRQLELEKNRLEAEIKNLYEYLTDDGRPGRSASKILKKRGIFVHFKIF